MHRDHRRSGHSALIELGARYFACRAIRFMASTARQYLSDIRGEHA
jgi:hypothetical protein